DAAAEISDADGSLLQRALTDAISQLNARDRLRLGCYYQQDLTLAETGRVLGEHEATVSRQLARTRRTIREHVQRRLSREGFSDGRIDACFEAGAQDAGPIDFRDV